MNHCFQNHEPDCDCDSCRGNRNPLNTEHRLTNHIAVLTAERNKLIGLLKEVVDEVDMWALGIDLKGRIQAAIAEQEKKA